MKIHIFFEEDGPDKPTQYTDFNAREGFFDLNDLRKYFKSASIDYNSPHRGRFMEALTMLTGTNIDLNSKIIRNRFYPNKKQGDE